LKHVKDFTVHPGWRMLMKDIGIRPADVLRRAGLPDDLFSRDGAVLTVEEYFALWRGLESEANDPLLPLRLQQVVSVEAFDAPIFAALCSANLNMAIARLSRFKSLVGPISLLVQEEKSETMISIAGLENEENVPDSLIAVELVFLVHLVRLATREEIQPLQVVSIPELAPAGAYYDYFGVMPEQGKVNSLVFSAEDAKLPFLTENNKMWEFFEPELQQRLSELADTPTAADQVRGALLELLPSGLSSMDHVSKKLAISTRTLQRNLQGEATSFQSALNETREELARHYLQNSDMSGAEISYLLGYEDPNSFFRAFHTWTGETPERLRARV